MKNTHKYDIIIYMQKINFSKQQPKNTKKTEIPKTEIKPAAVKKAKKIKSSFKVGETIVYQFHGIGKIERIETNEIDGQEMQFFVISINSTKMTISIPIENAEAKGIRHLMSKDELNASLVHLGDKPESTGGDWKLRQQQNNNLVKKGDILSTIKVIVSLYSRNKEKELPIQERRLYDSSVTMLTEEISLVMNISLDEASKIISAALIKQ